MTQPTDVWQRCHRCKTAGPITTAACRREWDRPVVYRTINEPSRVSANVSAAGPAWRWLPGVRLGRRLDLSTNAPRPIIPVSSLIQRSLGNSAQTRRLVSIALLHTSLRICVLPPRRAGLGHLAPCPGHLAPAGAHATARCIFIHPTDGRTTNEPCAHDMVR